MANIVINDILDELRQENNRLFNENKLLINLLEKYRKYLLNLQNIDISNQISNELSFESLEEEFQRITKQNIVVKNEVKYENSVKFKKEVKDSLKNGFPVKTLKVKQIVTKNKSFNDSKVTKTKQMIKETEVKCDYKDCEQTFSLVKDLIQHQRTEHTIPEVKCHIEGCGRLFTDSYRLRLHLKNFHPKELFVCEWPGCEQSFKTKQSYKEHSLEHSSDQQFKCMFKGCSKVFSTERRLKSHTTAHMNGYTHNFPCKWPDCNMRFRERALLEGHINRKHLNIKPYKCDVEGCGRDFCDKRTLDSHTKFMHLKRKIVEHKEEGPFKCTVCTYETAFMNVLKGHITKMHTNSEKTVPCDNIHCNKMFRSRFYMLKHYSESHCRVYACDWPGCDFSTPSRRTIADHKLYHIGNRDLKCDFEGCDKSFITKRTLHQHRKTHLKRFVCSWPECEQRFAEEVYLKAHMNKHLNLRPFKCYIDGCNKDFKIDRHLKHHIRTVHKTKPLADKLI